MELPNKNNQSITKELDSGIAAKTTGSPEFTKFFWDALRLVVSAFEYSQVREHTEKGEMPGWIGTFFYFAKFLDEDSCFLEFSIKGIKMFVAIAERRERKAPESRESRAVELRIAKEEIKRGFPGLYSRHVVALWNMLDATLSESLVQLFVTHPEALQLRAFEKIKFSVVEYAGMSRVQMMRVSVRELKRWYSMQNRLNKGIRVYQEIYSELGINHSLTNEEDKFLIELRAIRNLIVHNMSIADDKFVKDCPWLGFESGTAVVASEHAYEHYKQAASDYVIESVMKISTAFDIPNSNFSKPSD